MALRFWDSSALIPLALQEPTSVRIRELLVQDPHLVLWWGTTLECYGALVRAGRSGRLTGPGVQLAQRTLTALTETGLQVEPTDACRDLAMRLVAVHPLRAADALQLAAALNWRHAGAGGSGFVSLDERLRLAAMQEGFSVFPAAEEVHE